MRHSTMTVAILSIASLASAQSEDRFVPSAPASDAATQAAPASLMALGSLVQGPIDVQTALTTAGVPTAPGTLWNRLLGCANAWGYYWVSGGAGITGAFMMHQFDTNGVYIQSFTQTVFNATQWGARDLAVDEGAFKLYGGMEGGALAEYTFNPGAGANGTLTFTTSYNLTGVVNLATVRALAINPNDGHFFGKNFNGTLEEFTINPIASVNSFAVNGKAAYGLAWDTVNDTLWSFDQNGIGGTYDLVEFNEIDPASGLLTGRTFNGTHYTVAGTNIAGGCDIFDDGSGHLKILSLHQHSFDELNVYELDPTASAPVSYCTAGTTSNNCVPSIAAANSPSASHANACVVTISNVEGQKNGIVFYGFAQAASPWGSGTSFLCVKAPTVRTPPQSSGGTAGLCDGTLLFDLDAYTTAFPSNPSTTLPWAPGDVVDVQAWFRDPPASKTTNLSNALELTFTP